MKRVIVFTLSVVTFLCPFYTWAQGTVEPDTVLTMKAKVLDVASSTQKNVPGTNVESTYQTIDVQVLDGPEKGKTVTVENDYLGMTPGQVFYLMHDMNALDGTDYYTVEDAYRLPQLALLGLLFVAVVLVLGGAQGARGLLALAASLFCISFLLLPGILHGYPPVVVSMGVASIIVVVGSYVTHGFNKTTTTAVYGMIATILVTGLLAYGAVPFAHLSGFNTEETTYLNIDTQGKIDFAGLLISAILIGSLGILYDASIGQAVAVEELASAGEHLSRIEVYRRALRIGREHIGALVNTLAIAYVGAALPLLLLFYGFGTDSIQIALNREIFATEIVRTIIGSIGLVLAVPITTVIAVRVLVKKSH